MGGIFRKINKQGALILESRGLTLIIDSRMQHNLSEKGIDR